MIIAIDGPAGAGKSTIAFCLAQALDLQLVDTGAIYRAVAWKALEREIDLDDGESLGALAGKLEFSFSLVGADNVLHVDGENPGSNLRTPQISQAASIVSAHPSVRQALLSIQRSMGAARSTVIEGRDIGTVVFPSAEVKVFLTASSEIRAQRRVDQMAKRGVTLDLDTVHTEILERDARDSGRDIAPLVCADDAKVIDSTSHTIDEIVAMVVELANTVD